MNLLARILSHGFAFAVVALLILVLVYRGDLFQEGELPEFLTFRSQTTTTEAAGSGAADLATGENEADVDVTAALPGRSDDAVAPGPVSDTGTDMPSGDEMPAADTESTAEPDTRPAATPETATGPAVNAEPDEGSGSTPVIEEASPPEAGNEPSPAPQPVTSSESAAEPPGDAAGATADVVVETFTAVEVQPAVAPDSSDESVTETPGDETGTTADVVVVETSTAVDVQPAVAPDSSDESVAEPPADTTGTLVDETVDKTSIVTEAPPETTADEAAPEETPAAVEPSEADTDIVPAVAPQAAPAHQESSQTNADAAEEAPYKIMAKARESFWLRDFEAAEQQYRKLTQLEPDNPDGYGELGNMYFSQGKWNEAAAAYYEAGTRLLNEGLVPQAREMLEVIRGLNGPQANDLEAQIAAATASSP